MNVLLVFPHTSERNIRPPLGLGYVASYLRSNIVGVKIRILDLTLFDDWVGMFEAVVWEFKPQVVGFSVPTVAYSNARELVRLLGKHRCVETVVFGGPHPSACSREVVAENPGVVVVRGEGERTFYEIVAGGMGGLGNILGVTFMGAEGVVETPVRPFIHDMDSVLSPARDLLNLHLYREKFRGYIFTTMMTSRGCPFQCVYCCKATLGTRWVPMSAERIMAELKEIKEVYGYDAILFQDDLFTLSEARIHKLCDLLLEEKLGIKWICVTRVDTVSPTLLEKMRKAGCISINFGVESGNPKILESIKKGITLEQAAYAFKWCRQLGIVTAANFMIGLPEDTAETIQDTIAFAKKLEPDYVQFTLTTPFPDTGLWRTMDVGGLIEKPVDWDYFRSYGLTSYGGIKPYFRHKNFTLDELLIWVRVAEKELRRHIILREVRRLNFGWLIRGVVDKAYQRMRGGSNKKRFKS